MTYQNDIDLGQFGVPRLLLLPESRFLSIIDKEEPVSETTLQGIANTLQGSALPTVIDIGRWSIYTTDSLKRKENLQKLIFVIESLRKARPELQFGYYGVVPQRVYEPLVDLKLNEWLAFNDAAKLDLVPHVDAIFPTLFTFYTDPKGWETFAKQTLKEAKRFNKPVFAFISPKFTGSDQMLNRQYLPEAYWRIELETCFKYCDGIVICNKEPNMDWNTEASWWKETKVFMDEVCQN